MPYTSRSEQTGGLPYSALRQKYETTAMGDDASETLRDHMRDGLRDTSCSATFFESDHKREDTHADEFLSLRYSGHRSGEEPWAPDLFLELTDRDPRGTALDPDFKQAQAQSWQRADNYKFYSDSSWSVPEREKRPQVLIAQLRDQFEATKRRLKIFSTSRDAASTGSAVTARRDFTREQESENNAVATRAEVLGIVRAQAGQGELQLGWQQTPDQEIRVAAIGAVRSGGARPDSEGFAATRRNNFQTQMQAQSQTARTGAATLMRTAMGQLWGTAVTQTGAASRDQSNQHARAHAEPGQREADASHREAVALGTVSRFIGQLNRESGITGQDVETQLQVVQFMDRAVTASRLGTEARSVAEDVVLDAKTSQFMAQHDTRGVHVTENLLARRNTNSTARAFESMSVAQLGAGRRRTDRAAPLVGEGYKQQSRDSFGNATQRAPDRRRAHFAASQQTATFQTADRAVRGLGTKYMREHQDTDRTLNSVADMA